MINIQNTSINIDQCGNLILPDGKIFYWFKEDKNAGNPARFGTIICNEDGSLRYGPIYFNSGFSGTDYNYNDITNYYTGYNFGARLLNGNIALFEIDQNNYSGSPGNYRYAIKIIYLDNSLNVITNNTYYGQNIGSNNIFPYGSIQTVFNSGFTKEFLTTSFQMITSIQERMPVVDPILGTISYNFDGTVSNTGNIDYICGYNHHTVCQNVLLINDTINKKFTINRSGTSGTNFYPGLMRILNNTTNLISYTSLNSNIIGNPANVILIKGYNNKIYVIYKTTSNQVFYRIWDTITNTFSSENILSNLKSTNILGDTDYISFTLFNGNKILLGHSIGDGYSQSILTQDLTTNLLTYSGVNISGIVNKNNKSVLLGGNENIGYISSIGPNYFSSIGNTSFLRTSSQNISSIISQEVYQNFSNYPCTEYSHLSGILKNSEENSYDGNGNIYTSIKGEITSGVYNCFFSKIQFGDPVFQTSTFTSINFNVTGMTSFKFEATQTANAGSSIVWYYSIDNGSNYIPFNNNDTITTTSNQLKFKSVLTPNGEISPTIYDYKVTIYK